MKTLKNYKEEEFEFHIFYYHEFKGRGGWNIVADVTIDDKKETFRTYTTNSQFIDEISELKADDATFEEIQEKYHSSFFDYFEDDIIELHDEIIEED